MSQRLGRIEDLAREFIADAVTLSQRPAESVAGLLLAACLIEVETAKGSQQSFKDLFAATLQHAWAWKARADTQQDHVLCHFLAIESDTITPTSSQPPGVN